MHSGPDHDSEVVQVQIDAVLLEILQAEIADHTLTIQNWLHDDAPTVTETLLRALHNCSGAFVMAEVPIVCDTLALAEHYVRSLLARQQPASQQGVAQIGALVDLMRATGEGLRAQPSLISRSPELDARLRALCAALTTTDTGSDSDSNTELDSDSAGSATAATTAAAPAAGARPPKLDTLGLHAAPIPEAPIPKATAPETPAPEAIAPETPAPEAMAPEAMAPETPAPEAPALEAPTPEAPTPEAPMSDRTDDIAQLGRDHDTTASPADDTAQDPSTKLSDSVPGEPEPDQADRSARFAHTQNVQPCAEQEQVRIRADVLAQLSHTAAELQTCRVRQQHWLEGLRAVLCELKQIGTPVHVPMHAPTHDVQVQALTQPVEVQQPALADPNASLARLQSRLHELGSRYQTLLAQQARLDSDLQENLAQARLVPTTSVIPRLRRVLRQSAAQAGKQARLCLHVAHDTIDRDLLQQVAPLLQSLVRNAVVHGLESPALRRAAGKSEEGRVHVVLRYEGMPQQGTHHRGTLQQGTHHHGTLQQGTHHHGGHLVLEVGDDGAGFDYAALRQQALARGLLPADATLADHDLAGLLLEPSGPAAERVHDDIGMDGVARRVRQLGGAVEIASRAGEGVVVTLRLPKPSALTQAILVRVGQNRYAVPIFWVSGVDRIARQPGAQASSAESDQGHRLDDQRYEVYDLGRLLDQTPVSADDQSHTPLLLIRSGEVRVALAVDQVLGSREIVVQSGSPQLASIPGIFGAAVVEDDSVVMVLDVVSLVRRHVLSAQLR